MPTWLARTLAASVLFVLAMMPIHAFVSTWGGTAIGPLWLWKSWKELLLALMAIAGVGWVVVTPDARREVFRDRLAQLVLAYVCLWFVLAMLNVKTVGLEATSAGLAAGLRYMVIAFVGYILLRFTKANWSYIVRKAMIAIVGVGVLLSILGLLQVTVLPRDILESFGYEKNVTIAPFMVIDENPDAPRAFATLRGPNELGAFLILPLVASLLVFSHKWWRVAIAALIGYGILLPVSRSAWIGAVLALVSLLVIMYGRGILRSKRFVYGCLAGVIAVALLMTAALSVPSLRLAVFRSSPTDTSLTEGSTDQHLIATMGGLSRVIENPLGCGPGCAGPASYYGSQARISENYYVQIAEEVGVVGLALWLAIVWRIAKRLFEQRSDPLAKALLASFIGISAIGLWLHVWHDDPLSITWWGLAGATLGYYASAKVKKPVR